MSWVTYVSVPGHKSGPKLDGMATTERIWSTFTFHRVPLWVVKK